MSTRRALNPATINANTADRINSARTLPAGCVAFIERP